mgnify:FL=1
MVKLEELVRQNPSHFELRETAGLRQLFLLEPLADLELLKAYYSQDTTNVEAAA